MAPLFKYGVIFKFLLIVINVFERSVKYMKYI